MAATVRNRDGKGSDLISSFGICIFHSALNLGDFTSMVGTPIPDQRCGGAEVTVIKTNQHHPSVYAVCPIGWFIGGNLGKKGDVRN